MPETREAFIERLVREPKRPAAKPTDKETGKETSARYRDFVDDLNKAKESDIQRAELATR